MTVLHANCCEVCGFVHRKRVNVAHFRSGKKQGKTCLCPNRILTPAIVIPEGQILRNDRYTITVRKRSA